MVEIHSTEMRRLVASMYLAGLAAAHGNAVGLDGLRQRVEESVEAADLLLAELAKPRKAAGT